MYSTRTTQPELSQKIHNLTKANPSKMSWFSSAPEPKSPLGVYRLLAPTAGVRVSPLCLGAMNFGDAWKDYMGECGKEQTEKILDFFYENGGNFVDT